MASEGADISHFPRWPMPNFETLITNFNNRTGDKAEQGQIQ